jgi:molybdate-binding protein
VKVIRVGARTLVQPLHRLGAFMSFAQAADGIVTGPARSRGRAQVTLLRDSQSVENQVLIAGCNPAMFLAAEHVRRRSRDSDVVVWSTGSEAALAALKRGEVHAAGVHIVDERSGQSNLPYLRRHLDLREHAVVTFAAWEQGWIVAHGNPRRIGGAGDLAKTRLRLVNRETGSGARRLLDRELGAAGIRRDDVPGYERAVGSHLEVAWLIKQGLADAGIGVRAAAGALGLSFIAVQKERYDLVIPKAYMEMHAGLSILLDTIASRRFRTDMDALGGYDTRETGKLVDPDAA